LEYKELGRTGEKIPTLGLGTWGIGGFTSPDTAQDATAIRALRRGIELGMTLIDTAEMYGGGHTEEIVGEAIAGIRERVFIATKVSAEHLRYDDLLRAAEGSLKRLNVSCIDLYQVHWPNPRIPISETMKAMERLVTQGKVRYIGVSNFSVEETRQAMESLARRPLASNQVEYSLLNREIESDLLPFCQRNGVTVIAYTPLAKGRVCEGRLGERLRMIGEKYGKTPAQVALNWLISKQNVIAIPKCARSEHIEENAGAIGWRLRGDDVGLLDRSLPNPRGQLID